MEDNADRLLGTLDARTKAQEDRLKKMEDDLHSVRKDVLDLKEYVIEAKGGRKMLLALLSASAIVGGFVWEVVQRLMVFK